MLLFQDAVKNSMILLNRLLFEIYSPIVIACDVTKHDLAFLVCTRGSSSELTGWSKDNSKYMSMITMT